MKCCKLTRRISFVSMITLTASLFIVEIVVGYVTNSMALVADSFHMLSDVVALVVGFIALRFSKIGTQNGRYTYGWARAEVLGALVNAVFLVALCFSILVEALKRIAVPEQLSNPKLVLIAGGIGLFVNIIGLFLFHGHGHGHSHGGHGHSDSDGHGGHEDLTKGNMIEKHGSEIEVAEQVIVDKTEAQSLLKPQDYQNGTCVAVVQPLLKPQDYQNGTCVADSQVLRGTDKVASHVDIKSADITDVDTADAKHGNSSPSSLNIRGVYLHVLGDALGSVIVMISALIILYTSGEWTKYVDPSLSIMMVLIILKTSLPLLKESFMILMQTVPAHIKVTEIQEMLVASVPGILNVHELHVWQLAGNRIIASAHVRCKTQLDYMKIASEVKEFFHNKGIHSTTIQPEFIGTAPKGSVECLLECDQVCSPRKCCIKDKVFANPKPIS